MNRESPFIFNGKFYYAGTIVKIKEEYSKHIGFHTILKFTGYIVPEKMYCFSSLQNQWEIYKMSREQVSKYIGAILSEGTIKNSEKQMEPKYVDGMVSAWILYILAMFFSAFLKNPGDIITAWLLSTFVFFNWRRRKIKGG